MHGYSYHWWSPSYDILQMLYKNDKVALVSFLLEIDAHRDEGDGSRVQDYTVGVRIWTQAAWRPPQNLALSLWCQKASQFWWWVGGVSLFFGFFYLL